MSLHAHAWHRCMPLAPPSPCGVSTWTCIVGGVCTDSPGGVQTRSVDKKQGLGALPEVCKPIVDRIQALPDIPQVCWTPPASSTPATWLCPRCLTFQEGFHKDSNTGNHPSDGSVPERTWGYSPRAIDPQNWQSPTPLMGRLPQNRSRGNRPSCHVSQTSCVHRCLQSTPRVRGVR